MPEDQGRPEEAEETSIDPADRSAAILGGEKASTEELTLLASHYSGGKGGHDFGKVTALLGTVLERESHDGLGDLVKALERDLAFGHTRRLLEKAREDQEPSEWLEQERAKCTYMDAELHPGTRFRDALSILEGIGLREQEGAHPETLRLGGAIYKRMWEFDGRIEHLWEALELYKTAYESDKENDYGYGGINAAYILEILAYRARVTAHRYKTGQGETSRLEGEAKEIREDITQNLKRRAAHEDGFKENYWYVVTLAEALFGLRDYESSASWLEVAHGLSPSERDQQTTSRQLATIAAIQGIAAPEEDETEEDWNPAWRAIQKLQSESERGVFTAQRGKLGLALSGGGFRASLYHLGVLARLAEADVLRSVEVLSTVSGGSIVGAQYYLEVKRLLETKKSVDITRKDYIDIVEQLQEEFLKGIQKNLRTRVLSNLGASLKMIFSKRYSRSNRVGELYEKDLYTEVDDGHPKSEPRYMHQLLVRPEGEKKGFRPAVSNWRRSAKVPVLLLNTTSLNSGHNWQFTGSWMGEPPGLQGDEVDKNSRYRRMYYAQAPDDHRNQRLGYAVAASACVPALFEPLAIEGLYPERTVRLVDGGVHDNQGTAGLLDEGCTFIFCSDASGQMDNDQKPSDGLLAVGLRSNSILMDRVREAQYEDLRQRVSSGSLKGLFFVHLKKDLNSPPVDWIKSSDPSKKTSQETWTPYGIDKDLQQHLAAIRTDLDSFSEVEAYSLMCSGYLMAKRELETLQQEHIKDGEPGKWGGFDTDAPSEDWTFLGLEQLLKKPADCSDPQRADLGAQLELGASQFFRAWKRILSLRIIGKILAVAAGVGVALLIVKHWDYVLKLELSTKWLVSTILFSALSLILPIIKWSNPQRATRSWFIKAAAVTVGFIIANVHLWTFDKLFLKWGRLDRLLRMAEEK